MKKVFLILTALLAVTLSVSAEEDFRLAWRAGFMETCVIQPEQQTACECVADKLLEFYPGDKITRFSFRMIDGEMTPEDRANMVYVFTNCKDK